MAEAVEFANMTKSLPSRGRQALTVAGSGAMNRYLSWDFRFRSTILS